MGYHGLLFGFVLHGCLIMCRLYRCKLICLSVSYFIISRNYLMVSLILLGLFIDIVLVALVKAYTRRRRPRLNTDDALGQIGPDVFSFPSGHASRAVYVAYFFVNLYALPMIFVPFVLVWATCVCFSRLLLNRHHILDVAGGVFLGLVEGWILGFLWLEDDTAKSIMNMLSDEKLDGGEFHV